MPNGGGEGKTVVPNVHPTMHAMDDTYIYWISNQGKAIYRAKKN